MKRSGGVNVNATAQADRQRAAEMRANGMGYREIGMALNRDPDTVRKWTKADAAPTRNQRGDEWTEAEDAKLLTLKTSGKKWSEIAAQIPGRTFGACEGRWRILRVRHGLVEPKAKRASENRERHYGVRSSFNPARLVELSKGRLKLRQCMTCRADFASEGAHHRMCAGCRVQSVTVFDTDYAVRGAKQ